MATPTVEIWDCDDAQAGFAASLFGYSLATPDAGRGGRVGGMEYSNEINPDIYCVENPDGLRAADGNARVWLKHDGTHFGAAVCKDSGEFRTAALAVPVETFLSESDRAAVFRAVLRWFSGEGSCPTCTSR